MTDRTPDPITADGEPHIERARYAKASKIAERIEALFGTQTVPTNEAVRLAAQILAAEGAIADRPQSDRTCEIVRVILATRDAMFHFVDTTAQTVAERDAQRAQDAVDGRALLEGM